MAHNAMGCFETSVNLRLNNSCKCKVIRNNTGRVLSQIIPKIYFAWPIFLTASPLSFYHTLPCFRGVRLIHDVVFPKYVFIKK